jgi:hypothetical protein
VTAALDQLLGVEARLLAAVLEEVQELLDGCLVVVAVDLGPFVMGTHCE